MDLFGRERRPLFVSVLLHGNEDTGLAAAQEVLRRHLSRELHRSLLLFVGNVAAAAANVRTLPGQADYNRVWPGTPTPDIPEAHMARWVFDYAASRRPFASIGIHNNTGLNPHYACITRLEPQFIVLARLFSRTIVHFDANNGSRADRRLLGGRGGGNRYRLRRPRADGVLQPIDGQGDHERKRMWRAT